jgi:hypothetical protein
MPHSSDDPPSLPPAEDAATEVPTASRPDDAVEGALEGVGEVAETPTEGHQDGAPQRPRRRRRRRRRPAPTPAGAAELGEAQAGEAPSSPDLTAGESAESAVSNEAGTLTPPRRRRRRRRPMRDAGSQSAVPDGGSPTQEPGSSQDGAENPPDESLRPAGGAQTRDPAAREQPRRRSRRRRPARAEQMSGGAAREGSDANAGGAPRQGAAIPRRPRIGGLQDRRPNDAAPRQPEPRGDQRGRRTPAGSRPNDGRDRGRRGMRDKGPRDRRQGRGRDAPQKKVEQKLYALESVVDRGFEDVADQSDESATRRVHWTILKRTVADQKSGKPMSAVYVLQREGVESEFPNLGAARLAVNKTIVHPEKLTLSKAEHAAAKK